MQRKIPALSSVQQQIEAGIEAVVPRGAVPEGQHEGQLAHMRGLLDNAFL